ncbi:MAG: integration host factor subunit beta [Bacteroidales bacterium]|nr:integration host factor subunit beta [Bacteroidales bacterium]
MTKAEIVAEVARRTGIERVAVQVTIEEMMNTIKENMINGENVYLRGFGTFELKQRAEKTARNITKNTTVIVPAHKIPKFKPCKEFMEKVK